MIKSTVLFLVSTIAIVNALHFVNVDNQLIGKRIQIESLQYHNRWLDAHHARWARFTYAHSYPFFRSYTPTWLSWAQFRVVRCGPLVCLQSVQYPNSYVRAQRSFHISIAHRNLYSINQNRWRIECAPGSYNLCRFYSPAYHTYLDAYNSASAILHRNYGIRSRFRIVVVHN